MKLKIFVKSWNFHNKNIVGLKLIIKNYFEEVHNLDDADICYSPIEAIDVTKYPTKKFIFGPHFSTFPNNAILNINNKFKNAMYVHPSNWTRDVFLNDFNVENIPVYTLPFPINFDNIKPNNIVDRINCFIYFKRRNPEELKLVENKLKNIGFNPTIINYNNGYNEAEYFKLLNESKFGIWVGEHESQGFALEEALAFNVPLLIWNVSKMSQEYNCPSSYNNIKTNATTIAYWNEKCGEVFYEQNEFNNKLNIFLENINKNIYQPRNSIKKLLSSENVYNNYWIPILSYFNLK